MLAARMQLRYVLASDAEAELPFAVAARARALTAGAALLAIVAGAFQLATPATAATVVLVAVIRAAEDAGDLLLGLAQRADDWPPIARSLALRGLGGAAVLGLTLGTGAGLRAALPAAAAWQAALTLWHDWPAVRSRIGPGERASWRRACGVVRSHWALGAAAALVSLNAYAPRYAVERFLGLELLGVFTALAQLALAGNLAVQAIGQAALARLGRLFREDRRAFARRVLALVAVAALVGLGGLAGVALWGAPILGALYTPEYAGYGDVLGWLMAAAGCTYVTAMLGYALVAAGERSAQLRVFSLSAFVSLAASLAATPVWGLAGAAAALLAAWAAAAVLAARALQLRVQSCPPSSPLSTLNPWPRTQSARPGVSR
jgi:O-antigen/teichoic acid export membrane protein